MVTLIFFFMITYFTYSDPPNAVAERSMVLGGEDCSIELVCNVEGEEVIYSLKT